MCSYMCRTCLESVVPDSCRSLSSPIEDLDPLHTIGEAVKDLISEFNLNIIENPLICSACYEDLLTGIRFKYKCVSTEELIKRCIDSEADCCVVADESFVVNNNESQQVDQNVDEGNFGGAVVAGGANNFFVVEPNSSNEPQEKEQPTTNEPAPYECTACRVTFENYDLLKHHAAQAHNVEQLYSCKECQNIFTNVQRAQEHALQHIGSGKYCCEDMIRILPFYVSGIPKTCEKCQQNYLWCCQFKNEPSELCCKCLSHRGTFSVVFERPEKQKGSDFQEVEISALQCSHCTKSFLLEDEMERHLLTHQKKRYSCKECDQTFSRKNQVDDHVETKHRGLGAYKCNKCPKIYTKRESFTNHLKWHDGVVFNICERCGKSFTTKGDLAKHLRRHLGKKRYQCPYCGLLFLDKYAVTEHERIHTENNKLVCEVCGKVLSTSTGLTNHKAKHCDIGRYKCKLCDKTFKYKKQLESHIQDHNEHVNFKCHICDLNYPSCVALRRHQRKKHILSSKTTELQPTQPIGTSLMQF